MPDDADRARHAQPDLARDDHAEHLGCANADGKSAKSARGGAVGIATDVQHAGMHVAAFGHEDVADPFQRMESGNAVLAHPFPGNAPDLRFRRVASRNEVVGDHGQPVRIPDADAKAAQVVAETPRSRRIGDHGEIDLRYDHLTRPYFLAPARARQNLLADRKPHCLPPRTRHVDPCRAPEVVGTRAAAGGSPVATALYPYAFYRILQAEVRLFDALVVQQLRRGARQRDAPGLQHVTAGGDL